MTFEERIVESARRWIGLHAPFAPHGRSERYGIDCVNLAHVIYTEAGMNLPDLPRRYFMDSSRHQTDQTVMDWIESIGSFQEIPLAESYPVGTLLCADIGRSPYHVAIVIDNAHAVHSIRRAGVCCVAYGTEIKKITHAFKPIQ